MRNKTIALAGVFQASMIAHELANSGEVRNQHHWHVLLDSLYRFDAESTEAVYGNKLNELSQGFETLVKAFNKDTSYINVLKYTLTLLSLETKLSHNETFMNTIANEIQASKAQQIENSKYSHEIIKKLADVYSSTVSMLQPRVVVSGKPYHLKQKDITEKIRATLLAGIRSAVLWRQMGGSQWQILFKRKHFVNEANKLLTI